MKHRRGFRPLLHCVWFRFEFNSIIRYTGMVSNQQYACRARLIHKVVLWIFSIAFVHFLVFSPFFHHSYKRCILSFILKLRDIILRFFPPFLHSKLFGSQWYFEAYHRVIIFTLNFKCDEPVKIHISFSNSFLKDNTNEISFVHFFVARCIPTWIWDQCQIRKHYDIPRGKQ